MGRRSPRLPLQLRCSQQTPKNGFDWCPFDFRADIPKGTTPLQVEAAASNCNESNKGTAKKLAFPLKTETNSLKYEGRKLVKTIRIAALFFVAMTKEGLSYGN